MASRIDPLDRACGRLAMAGSLCCIPLDMPHLIATSQGIEVLMAIGLDTVALKGAGFTICMKVGDK